MAETCCLVATIPEAAALLLSLQFVPTAVVICRGNGKSQQTEQLILKCANLLLSSSDPKILLLCAKSFFRCQLYRKCIEVLERIDAKDDEKMKETIMDLKHFASQCEQGNDTVDSMKLAQSSSSYFEADGGADLLLHGQLDEEELNTKDSVLEEMLVDGKNLRHQALTVCILHLSDS